MLYTQKRRAFSFNERQEGQAIVIIALVMVVLLGFTALAVDGGGIYIAQRNVQNAIDSSSQAAAHDFCLGVVNWQDTGLKQASVEGYSNDSSTTVEFVAPPTFGSKAGDPTYAQGLITDEVQTYFVQLVFNGPIQVQASGIWHCVVPYHALHKSALFASSTTCQDAINIAQSAVTINGGITSNNDLKASGNYLQINGDGNYLGTYQSDAIWDPGSSNPQLMSSPLEESALFNLVDFLPGGSIANAAEAEGLYHRYTGNTSFNTNAQPQVFEGLYVVEGGNLTILGSNYTVGPRGVTFVTTGTLKASANNISGLRHYREGLLIGAWGSTNCGTNAVDISASTTNLEGIIYAPNGGVKITASDSISNLAIFSKTIDLHGDNLTLNWFEGLLGVIKYPIEHNE